MKNEWISELQKRTDIFVPVMREMFASKNENIASDVQKRLNMIGDLLLGMPPYRDMGTDIKTRHHFFSILIADSEKWQEATTPETEGRKRMDSFFSMIGGLLQNLLAF
ncbi:hypothetical protein [Acutalibacter intestini]|uniref:hypothetical protein n=1 Tax=Acutalibacter intestini TaxID=3093659 RepID=UPI002AC8F52D|nr:hypothetical protein [Acutalibacter sp. M00204]